MKVKLYINGTMKTTPHPNRVLRTFTDDQGVECAELRLGNSHTFIIDAADVPAVLERRWRQDKCHHRPEKVYVHSYRPYDRLHRFLLGVTDPKQYVDHRDGDPCNNRRSNLRLATYSQNSANSIRTVVSSTGYIGVYKVYNKYHARIKVNRRKEFLGTFDTPEEAAMAYNWAALRAWWPFARVNEILSLAQLGQLLLSHYTK